MESLRYRVLRLRDGEGFSVINARLCAAFVVCAKRVGDEWGLITGGGMETMKANEWKDMPFGLGVFRWRYANQKEVILNYNIAADTVLNVLRITRKRAGQKKIQKRG